MNTIKKLNVVENQQQSSANACLRDSMKSNFDEVLVIGTDENGNIIYHTNVDDVRSLIYNIEVFKTALFLGQLDDDG